MNRQGKNSDSSLIGIKKKYEILLDKIPRKPLVLVIDKTEVDRAIIQDRLDASGNDILFAMDERSALELVQNESPDLILLNIDVPGIDGFETLDKLKSDPEYTHIPVLVIAEINDQNNIIRALNMGASDYLSKPFIPIIFDNRVKSCLARKLLEDREKQVNQQLEKNHLTLIETEKARDGLFYMIVHDLNNPLFGVLGKCEILLSRIISGNLQEDYLIRSINEILISAQRMAQLVQGILDVSRMESGSIPLKIEKVDSTRLLSEVCNQQMIYAELSGVALSWRLEKEDTLINADRALMNRTLQNLIGNAIKYTNKGDSVKCSIERESKEVIISIRDNGPGIPEEKKDRIFDKFYQIGEPKKGIKYGVGLGLAFCKLAIEAQGGRIWVENIEGQGTCFRIAIPSVNEQPKKSILPSEENSEYNQVLFTNSKGTASKGTASKSNI